jgi:CHC2 zinc finger/Toprim domain
MISADLVELARETDLLEVARACGVTLKRVAADEHAGPCVVCGGRDRFAVNARKQIFNCRGCGAKGNVIAFVEHVEGCSFAQAVERLVGATAASLRRRQGTSRPPQADDADAARRRERDLAIAAKIVAEKRPLIFEPRAKRYLHIGRKIDVGALWEDLKQTDAVGWHDRVYFHEPEWPERGDPPHPLHGQELGCIIGVMSDPVTTRPTGAISRTYIGPDGTKVGKAKTLGSPRGIIRLSGDDEVLGGLFIAEGLETALSGMAIGLRPMWACGDSGLMASFPVLAGIEALNVIVDHDENGAGERAAREVEARWLAAGCEVNLLRSDALGDLNDALKGGAS